MKKRSLSILTLLVFVFCATTSVAVEVSTVDELTTALASATDGTVIELADGTYELSAKITLSSGVTIRSVSGRPEDVIIKPSAKCRPFDMKHAGAELSGLQIEGWTAGAGAGEEGGGGESDFTSKGGGGTVTNCVIRNGNPTDQNYNAQGGGICMKGPGLVTHCVITNNAIPHTATYQNGINDGGGMGVYIDNDDAIVRNCLIAGNTSLRKPNGTAVTGLQEGIMGAVRINAGLLESCTIAGNESLKCSGVYATGGIVRNCLIGNNTTTKGPDAYSVYAGNGSCFDYCAAPIAIDGGQNCLVVPTPFVSFERGDYRPMPGTACIDGGYYDSADEGVAWMATANDLPRADHTANGRIKNDTPDIGAYELNESERSEFIVNFSVDKTSGFVPFKATFTAVAANAGDNVGYKWYVDGEEVENETESVFVYLVDSVDAVTTKKISLVVKKADGTRPEITPAPISVTIYPTMIYASPGKDVLQPLVASALDGNEIVLASGTYEITTGMTIDKKLIIRSASGRPEDVIIKPSAKCRPFNMKHTGAELSGLTIEGWGTGAGAGAEGGGGVIAFPSTGGGGIVTNCVIRNGNCTDANYNAQGGGICMKGPGLVTHCVITNNSIPYTDTNAINGSGGSGVYIDNSKAKVRNCLIAYNSTLKYPDGSIPGSAVQDGQMGAVIIVSGEMENCTIVGNEGRQCAGVNVKGNSAIVRNCLISNNTSTHGTEAASVYAITDSGVASCFSYCVSPIAIDGGQNCYVVASPMISFANGNYNPMPQTDVVNKGYCNVEWMDANATDITGVNKRILDGAPDVGAYELDPEKTNVFLVNVTADVTDGFEPLEVTFSADVVYSGEGTVGLQWTVDGQNIPGATQRRFTHTFGAGITEITTYEVSLQVQTSSNEEPLYPPGKITITVNPTTLYPVADDGDTVGTLNDAVDVATDRMEIVLDKGCYTITKEIVLDRDVTIRSREGLKPEDVIIKPNGKRRAFSLFSAGAVLSGLTIEGYDGSSGMGGKQGGGVILFPSTGAGSMVTNCIIRNGLVDNGNYQVYGGGVSMFGPGTLTHCVITNNSTLYSASHEGNKEACGGSGVYLSHADAKVLNCLIAYNSTLRKPGEADYTTGLTGKTMGAVIVERGRIANCTITMNEGGQCAGVNAKTANGIVDKCLIAANASTNVASNASWPVYAGNASCFRVCGAPIAIEGGKNCIEVEENPFWNLENGDFRLLSSSRAVNVVKTGVDELGFRCDLLGKKRVVRGKLDLGCYECQSGPLILMLR